MNENDRLYTVREVAEYLKVRPATLRKMAREGKIGYIKTGTQGHFRFSRNHVSMFIAERSKL